MKTLRNIIYFFMCLDSIAAVIDAMAFDADSIPAWFAVMVMALCALVLVISAIAIWIMNVHEENEKRAYRWNG